jgi:hypothetical protein
VSEERLIGIIGETVGRRRFLKSLGGISLGAVLSFFTFPEAS